MIDRYLLRYLLAVVDYGSFTRAAQVCRVSQPSLSAGIAKLEQEVGTTLLLRTNRRVEVTTAGAQWVARARRIEREFTLGEQEARSARFATTLRIGVQSSLPKPWIEDALAQALAEPAERQIEIIETDEKTLFSLLDRERIDLALGIIPAGRSRFAEVIYTEGYRLALPLDHPLAQNREIHPDQVRDSPMLVRRQCEALADTSRYFTAHGVRPFMAARANSDEMALALVRAGLGLTVVPACFVGQGVALARLVGFDLTRDIGFVYRQISSERPTDPAIEIFKTTIRARQLAVV